MDNKIVFFGIGKEALIGAVGGALWGQGSAISKKLRKPDEVTWDDVRGDMIDNAAGGALSGAGIALGLRMLRGRK